MKKPIAISLIFIISLIGNAPNAKADWPSVCIQFFKKILAPPPVAKEVYSHQLVELPPPTPTLTLPAISFSEQVSLAAKNHRIEQLKNVDGFYGSYWLKDGDKVIALWKPRNAIISSKDMAEQNYIPASEAVDREVAAYYIDQILGFNLVPETFYFKLNDISGSVQANLGTGYSTYYFRWQIELAAPDEYKITEIEKISSLQLQKMAIFDFIIGNTDRHFQNWMVKNDYTQIAAIDNGNSFPLKRGTYSVHYSKSKSWMLGPHIKEKIPDEIIKVVQSLDVESLSNNLKQKFKIQEEALELMRERIRIMREVFSRPEEATIEKINLQMSKNGNP